MNERDPDSYWPGYVDVLSNMVLALIYVVMVLSIGLSIQSTRAAQKLVEALQADRAAPQVPEPAPEPAPEIAPEPAPEPVAPPLAAPLPEPPGPPVRNAGAAAPAAPAAPAPAAENAQYAAAPDTVPDAAPDTVPDPAPDLEAARADPAPQPAPQVPPVEAPPDPVVAELQALVASLRAERGLPDLSPPVAGEGPAPPRPDDTAREALRELRVLLAERAGAATPDAGGTAGVQVVPPAAPDGTDATAAASGPSAHTAPEPDRIEVAPDARAGADADRVDVRAGAGNTIVILFPNSVVALDAPAASSLADRIGAFSAPGSLSVDIRIYSPQPYLAVERMASVSRAASVLQALVALGVPQSSLRVRIVEHQRSEAVGEVHLALSMPGPEAAP